MAFSNERTSGSRSLDRPDTRRDWNSPMKRWSDLFDHLPFGFWAPPRDSYATRRGQGFTWMPQVESFQRNDEFVVRADLPGLEKKDITVEVEDDALVIQGERSNENNEQREGYYTSERSYGTFCRIVPLPEGALADTVKASFKNGVLEVVVKAPPHEVSRGRRVEISDGR
ncbi:MAG TPA: Hsp20/alpha crystallin family protein [Vicinamibacterales bacterium]|nr:Hsp20/alpha crystallin family protein [Vicinamibacterales bacterium]